MSSKAIDFVRVIRGLHEKIRLNVRKSLLSQLKEGRSPEAFLSKGHGDVSYGLDVRAEETIDSFFRQDWGDVPVVVICEGLGRRTYPEDVSESEIAYQVLIDPVDGTRELMYDKRSAWILTGIARNRGKATTLADVFFAMQTEVPPSKQGKGSVLWATRGKGACHEIWDIESPILLESKSVRSSRANDLQHGFVVFVDFFAPGPRLTVARLADRVLRRTLRRNEGETALVFNDQYISTGGQIYHLATGGYRLVVDVRPIVESAIGKTSGGNEYMCAHPYDLATALIATEAGAIITDAIGDRLRYPVDTDTKCTWIGYANDGIKFGMEKTIRQELKTWSIAGRR